MTNKTLRNKKRGIRRKPEPVDMASILRGPRQPTASHAPTPKLTPYAERLLARSHAPEPVAPSAALADDWITTHAAAKLTGYCRRHIYTLCEKGFFVEDKDWTQRPIIPGMDRAGKVLIRRAALKKLKSGW